jgi:hypothetical protein
LKIAHIVPTSLLPHTRFQDIHMMLPTELMKGGEYAEFYHPDNGVDGLRMLDNGVAESTYIQWDDLIRLAETYDAVEIVAPDEMGHCDQTIEWCRQFAPIARKNPEYRYVGVVQGKSYSEMVKCYMYYQLEADWVTVLALPRVLANTVHRDIRIRFVEAFADQIQQRFHCVHMLGGSSWVKEVVPLSDLQLVRSIDSSVAAVMGLEKRLVDQDDYIGRQPGFFEAKPNPKQLMSIQHNIAKLNEWAY